MLKTRHFPNMEVEMKDIALNLNIMNLTLHTTAHVSQKMPMFHDLAI